MPSSGTSQATGAKHLPFPEERLFFGVPASSKQALLHSLSLIVSAHAPYKVQQLWLTAVQSCLSQTHRLLTTTPQWMEVPRAVCGQSIEG